jgi:hypothetical protein
MDWYMNEFAYPVSKIISELENRNLSKIHLVTLGLSIEYVNGGLSKLTGLNSILPSH